MISKEQNSETGTLGAVLDRERAEDTRENLDNWISYLPTDTKNLVETLRRAYSAACVCEPRTALLLLKHLRVAEDLAWQFALLANVRSK